MKSKVWILLLTLTIIGGAFRFIALGSSPNSLTVDEVSTGYNGYSILKTGRDEYGAFLPLTFKSLGDYKPPLYIYLAAASEAIFGLNEFAVRFPSALLGTLSIPLLYLLIKELTGKKSYALLGAAIFTISPWHLYFSRIASEAQVANFFLVAGVICLLRMLKGRADWSIPAAGLMTLSMYTYHTPRLFVPLLLIGLFFFNRRVIWNEQRRSWLTFLVFTFIFSLPILYSMIIGTGSARAAMTIITHDPDFVRNVLIKPVNSLDNLQFLIQRLFGTDSLLLVFHWMRKYLAYFQPSFLFYSGLNMTTPGAYGLGVIYLFEIPLVILGTLTLIRKKVANNRLVIYWILAGLLPASLTMNEQHPIRTMVILPMTVLVSAIGAITLWETLLKPLPKIKAIPLFVERLCLYAFIGVVITGSLLHAFLIFTVHFPQQKGEAFMEGTKEAVNYILENENKYGEIVFDPVRGVEGPYLVSVPHLYLLFYGKVDPAIYQRMEKIQTSGYYHFGKYTIRPIDWRTDRARKGTLYIGSSWSLPKQDVKDGDVLDRVYLLSGQEAFLIVSPKL